MQTSEDICLGHHDVSLLCIQSWREQGFYIYLGSYKFANICLGHHDIQVFLHFLHFDDRFVWLTFVWGITMYSPGGRVKKVTTSRATLWFVTSSGFCWRCVFSNLEFWCILSAKTQDRATPGKSNVWPDFLKSLCQNCTYMLQDVLRGKPGHVWRNLRNLND